ncbi:fibre protein [Synechococcus phage S-CBS1]|uniref:tail fiber protein n=1 Tax=Synechococcus phage S-CBS1 TaxID=909297 RepID=UPI000231E286|nr:tail fiber protein [Synechococcus phage S-CBS1]ADP06615.1 fibre protein [Synechococcus phage S-CBS1]
MTTFTRFKLRNGTAAEWTAANPTLLQGEIGVETDTRKYKIGDGSTAWAGLSYYIDGVAIRGQCSKMTDGTIDITTQGTYVTTGLTATLDSSTAYGMVLGTDDAFGLKNDSGGTKLFRIYGSIDATDGNNSTLGVKLAKNGVAIDNSECRAFTGSGAQEAKLVTSWMVELDDGDEVSLLIANHSNTTDITLKRGRVIAVEVRA